VVYHEGGHPEIPGWKVLDPAGAELLSGPESADVGRTNADAVLGIGSAVERANFLKMVAAARRFRRGR
jgi:hypothetical protein